MELIERAKILLGKINKEAKQVRIREIEAQSTDPDFWKDTQRATSMMKEMASLQKELEDAEKLKQYIESNNTTGLESLLREMEIYFYLSGSYDRSNAILTIHAGQGGADAMDWAEMLKRMYTRFFERKGWSTEIVDETAGDEAGIKSIPITARQLEALIRLSEAAAKIRLAKTVSKKDAQKAIELVDYCLNQIAKDSETGKIDIDRLSSRITATQRSSISIIKDIINTLEEQMNSKIIPLENVVEAAKEKNIAQDQTEEILEKLRRSGDIFEPKRGFIQKL